MAKPKKEKPESKAVAAREARQEKKTGKKEIR